MRTKQCLSLAKVLVSFQFLVKILNENHVRENDPNSHENFSGAFFLMRISSRSDDFVSEDCFCMNQ